MRTSTEQLGSGGVSRGKSFQQNQPDKPVDCVETCAKQFSLIMVSKNNFRYQRFVAVTGCLEWKVA